MITSTVEEMATIRAIETQMAAPHGLGCFESWADDVADEGLATGDYDEIMSDGQLAVTWFHRDMKSGARPCRCPQPDDDAWCLPAA